MCQPDVFMFLASQWRTFNPFCGESFSPKKRTEDEEVLKKVSRRTEGVGLSPSVSLAAGNDCSTLR